MRRGSRDFGLELIASTSRHRRTATFAERVLETVRPAVAVALLVPGLTAAQTPDPPEPIGEDLRLEDTVAPSAGGAWGAGLRTEAEEADRRGRRPDRGLTLGLATGIGYDDNVFRTESDTDSDFFWNVRPSAYLDAVFGRNDFRLGYEGDYRSYFDYSTEDFYDHRVLGVAALDVSRKVDLNLSGHVLWGHDDRGGVGVRLEGSRDLDRWREDLVRAELVVGREITRAQIIPWVEYSQVRYLNNDQSDRDFNRASFWVRGRWRFTQTFWGLAEAGTSSIDHLDPSNDLDRTEPGVLVGFGWQVTAKTSGEVLVGLMSRDFEDPSRGDPVNFTYDININWAPKPYSRFTLYGRRESLEDASGESGGLGTLLASTMGLRWRHALTERLDFDSGIEYVLAEYDDGRDDDYLTFDFGLVQQLRTWLDVGVHYEHTRRRSNVPGINYDDNVVWVELRSYFTHGL